MSMEPEFSARKSALAYARFEIAEVLAGRVTVIQSLRSLSQTDFGRKFCRYFLAGGICALVDFFCFVLFLYYVDLHYLIAGTISFVVATGLNYVLSVRYVFDDGRFSRHAEITLVYIVSGISILINLGVLFVLIEFLAVHPMLAKIIGTGITFGWNFSTRYFWIFKR